MTSDIRMRNGQAAPTFTQMIRPGGFGPLVDARIHHTVEVQPFLREGSSIFSRSY